MSTPRWIVAVGASAGGVESLQALFSAMPATLDAAYLVVLHIPAHSPSHLDRVLGLTTRMTVAAANNGEAVKRGHVYVGTADQHLVLDNGVIRLTRGPKECRSRPAIDVLFRSAAVTHGPAVVGVLLSGMLDDGTAGLWAIKEHGGLALVQAPDDAQHASMPESAIRHVDVDMVGDCAGLARRIEAITRARPEPAAAPAAPVVAARLAIENRIASQANALQLGVMDMGKVSQYTCPDCHGVLVQIEEGSIARFRCHTGHAFSLQTLLAEISESIDKGLWDAIRAIEERILLLRQLGEQAADDKPETSRELQQSADEAERKIKGLKEMVMDPRLFGRQR